MVLTLVVGAVSRDDLAVLHDQFMKEHPSGRVDTGAFRCTAEELSLDPEGVIVRNLWRVFDRGGKGHLDFDDVVLLLSWGTRGPRESRIKRTLPLLHLLHLLQY